MAKHYLHLSAYRCDICRGPVVAGWVGTRENVISRETDIRQVGAICISCGHRQVNATDPDRVRHVMPMEWEPGEAIDPRNLTTPSVEALNLAEVR
jgi:hypothetical protein